MTNILVVDDDPNVALLVKMTLSENKDYNIEIAGNGDEALEKIEQNPPDLLLLDLMMPGIGGMEICKILKSKDATKYIPIIMLTAKREAADMILGMNSGANDYITKPFNPEELMARVRAHLRIKALEEEVASRKELEAVLKMSVTLQHEINNPLTGVIGNAELLTDRKNLREADIDEIAENILHSSMRIKEIIKQMGKVSRIVSTTYVGMNEMIDINKSSGPDEPGSDSTDS